MNIEMTDLDMILNHLETTSLESHDDYTSEITYKDQKILYRYIKELQKERNQFKEYTNHNYDKAKKLQQENQQLNLELSGYRQAILDDKEMLGLKDENQQLKIQISAREEEYKKLEKLVDTILNFGFFKNECPLNFGFEKYTNEDKAQVVFYKKKYCENNCNDDYKKCWLKYFERLKELE